MLGMAGLSGRDGAMGQPAVLCCAAQCTRSARRARRSRLVIKVVLRVVLQRETRERVTKQVNSDFLAGPGTALSVDNLFDHHCRLKLHVTACRACQRETSGCGAKLCSSS